MEVLPLLNRESSPSTPNFDGWKGSLAAEQLISCQDLTELCKDLEEEVDTLGGKLDALPFCCFGLEAFEANELLCTRLIAVLLLDALPFYFLDRRLSKLMSSFVQGRIAVLLQS